MDGVAADTQLQGDLLLTVTGQQTFERLAVARGQAGNRQAGRARVFGAKYLAELGHQLPFVGDRVCGGIGQRSHDVCQGAEIAEPGGWATSHGRSFTRLDITCLGELQTLPFPEYTLGYLSCNAPRFAGRPARGGWPGCERRGVARFMRRSG